MILAWPVYIFSFLVGAVWGSFLNVCIFRLPRGCSIVSPGSHCPHCQSPIHWYDNIPLVSFLVLRGRSRCCQQPISWQYPLVETLSALLAVATVHRFGFSPLAILYFLFISALVVVTFVDLHHQIIPDEVSLSGIIVGLLASVLRSDLSLIDSALGVIVGGGILWLVAFVYQRLTGREGMGGGDIKLLAMIGAFLGWKAIPFVIFLSALVGSLVGILLMLFKRGATIKLAIPYGPFLSLGALIWVFFGEKIILFYLGGW
ncbi:prepilin peptidase [Thermosulfuriphilus sp.]